jgi:hypothetical protein
MSAPIHSNLTITSISMFMAQLGRAMATTASTEPTYEQYAEMGAKMYHDFRCAALAIFAGKPQQEIDRHFNRGVDAGRPMLSTLLRLSGTMPRTAIDSALR